jgi:hypothetical protein
MSKKPVRSRCLVIDASVAGAAGPMGARHPSAASCRDFLVAVRGLGHRMAWSPAVKAEWERRQSAFALQWRVSMTNLNKLRHVKDEPVEELREAIEGDSEDKHVAAIMRKDAHLIEAALATDSRLASLDEAARGHFGRLAATLDSLRRVNWVNPADVREQVVKWLQEGAPLERSRRLGP